MGIKIVRTPSETPNITNVDDIIPFRYAYGNQNGYVIGRGNQLDGSYESGEFTVGSGRAVIQGVEVDIDANGISTTLDTAQEERYFKIYLKVNLANDVADLESYYSTVSYDEIQNPTAGELINNETAYLLLYELRLYGSIQLEKNKVVKAIEYINKADFNKDSASQFGDYIVAKKKLLWSGSETIFQDTVLNITNLNATTLAGKKLAFLVRKKPLSYKTERDIMTYCPNFRTEGYPLSYYANIYSETLITDQGNFQAYGCEIDTFMIDVKIQNEKLVFDSYYLRYGVKHDTWGKISVPSIIKAIYEIIE